MSTAKYNEALVFPAVAVLENIAFDGVTEFQDEDTLALTKSMQTPDGKWENAALCLAVEHKAAFEVSQGQSYELAKEVCGRCTVRAQCLLNSLEKESNPASLRAGLTPLEIRSLRKTVGLGAKKPPAEAVTAINKKMQEIQARGKAAPSNQPSD